MTVAELRELLEPFGIRPVHDRGQHFLLDDRVVEKMVEAAKLQPGDNVLEIGPGPGILTEKLLATGATVVAVELDLKLRELLKSRFGLNERFHLLEGDILSFTNADLVAAFPIAGPYKLVANLPYAITSEVFKKFLLEAHPPESITVMIQREVADRVLAKRGDMNNLAIMVQAYSTVERVVNVAAGAFYPPPKVDSAVIHMTRKSEEVLAAFFSKRNPERFFSVTRAAFAERRKQLKNTLRAVQNDEKVLHKAFLESGIVGTKRPEELEIDEWKRLVDALTF